jgi:hypothetical protein
MEYLLAALGVLFMIYLTGKCKHWLRIKWYRYNLNQEKPVVVLQICNIEQQIEGLLREILTWRGYYAAQVEIVVVDLNSTDNSSAILERLQAKLQNFSFLNFDSFKCGGLSSLGFKIMELVVVELDGESDYISNLHKLKNVFNQLSNFGQNIEHQLMS